MLHRLIVHPIGPPYMSNYSRKEIGVIVNKCSEYAVAFA